MTPDRLIFHSDIRVFGSFIPRTLYYVTPEYCHLYGCDTDSEWVVVAVILLFSERAVSDGPVSRACSLQVPTLLLTRRHVLIRANSLLHVQSHRSQEGRAGQRRGRSAATPGRARGRRRV